MPCTTTGDGVNTVIELSWAETETATTLDELLKTDIYMTWLGQLWPLNDTYYNANKKLDALGTQVQTASDNELNLAQLQKVEQHDESSKAATMTSRVCVVDPQTGQMKTEVSKTKIVSADQPWLRSQGEGARRLSSFTTGYTQESQDYRLPETDIKVEEALPCGSPIEGKEKPQQQASSQFNNDYGNDKGSALFGIVYKILSWIELFTPEGTPSGFRGSVTGNAKIVGTAQNPYAGHADALTAGCASSSDLNDVSYATGEQKQKLCEAGGFVNSMYRPDVIDPTYTFELDAKDPAQHWEQSITNTQPQADLSNAFAGRVEAAGDYMNCALTQADYQDKQVPGGECNTNWVGGGASGGGWNCDTSVPEQSVPGLNSAGGQSYADRVYGGCASGTENAWKLCKNDVIARAKKACVDPIFALAIWLHESGASNYICGQQLSGGKVQDFGININSIAENFSAQLDRFLRLPNYYATRCPKTLRNFVSLYWFGNHCYDQESAGNKTKIDGYIGALQVIYGAMAPGVPLPAWPGGC